MVGMFSLVKEFFKSKNKIYFIIKHKGWIAATFAGITIVSGIIGFYDFDKLYLWKELFIAILKTFKLFGFGFPSIKELNLYTGVASIFALATITLTAVLFFFKNQINQKIFKNICKKTHIGIFGLGEISRTFLRDENIKENIIILEKDNTNIDEYRSRGFGVKVGDAFNVEFLQNNINFNNMEYALIAFGNDKLNIEFAKKVISIYKEESWTTPIKLIVHINDKNLSTLFSKSFILGNTTKSNINVKTFSYFEECARDLFDKYSIDGDSMDYIDSEKRLETILLGDDNLIKKIIYKIVSLYHLPNQNHHTIYIVQKDASSLLEDIKTYIHYGKDNDRDKFPTITLVAIDIDYKKQNFYNHEIWEKRENIENIIVCYDDESTNIQLGSILHNRVYLSDTIDDKKVPKIIMGVYSELELSDGINKNKCEYKNMYTFGNEEDILNKSHLINETVDSLSKLIHQGYGEVYHPDYQEIDQVKKNEKWFNSTKYTDKLSNISQARHIDIKLKSLGLRKVKDFSNKPKKELLKINRKILDNALDGEREKINDAELEKASEEIQKFYDGEKYEVKYWPESFDNNLFNKILRMEHDRWNAHHYLEGWKYSIERNKDKKEHNCLLPLEKFDNDNIKITTIYDMYSYLYLPNYLTETGYKICSYKTKIIGVTGHRNKGLKNKTEIKNIVKAEIKKLNRDRISHVISPLADGSDRIVAKYVLQELDANLIVPIPFKLEEYKKDFDDESEKEFEEILGCVKYMELSEFENKEKKEPIYDEDRNDLYKECGKYVVDNCDILFAIWDGKKANGTGGTGDIVEYAKEARKYIIHINSETPKVEYINDDVDC